MASLFIALRPTDTEGFFHLADVPYERIGGIF
jgi:hypothetical protein